MANPHLSSKTFRFIFNINWKLPFCFAPIFIAAFMICGCLRRYDLFYLLCNFHLTILRFYCILTQNESQWMQGIVIQNDLTKGDLEYQTRGVKVHAGILCGRGETLQLACVLN